MKQSGTTNENKLSAPEKRLTPDAARIIRSIINDGDFSLHAMYPQVTAGQVAGNSVAESVGRLAEATFFKTPTFEELARRSAQPLAHAAIPAQQGLSNVEETA